MSGTEIFKQASDLMFGQVREDALVDLYLVSQLARPERAFIIASGGCTALSLLLQEGLQIDALDISQAQISLVETKMAMFKHLGAEATTRACCSDATGAYGSVKKFLSPAAQNNMDSLILKNGLNNCGSIDRRMRQITALFYCFVHSKGLTERFLSLSNIEQQSNFYQRHWSNFQWRLALKVAFSKAFLYITHGKAAATLVPDDFHAVMEARLVKALTSSPNSFNPYLWQTFFGRYNQVEECLPPYLQAANQKMIIANWDGLRLTCADTLEWLGRQPDHSIDYFGLSNILELLPSSYAASLKREISRCARPNAIVCVRAIFPRKALVFAEHFGAAANAKGVLVFDERLSRQAEKMDRSLFCNFFEIYRCL
jgi:S-adenosylmethionine:diacylglycerol 3-amino-3-carboxypropyl transferase